MSDNNKDNDRTETWDASGERPDRPRIERLGHFRIEATLGSGGMGTIYRAYDESMKRPVALKVLHSSLELSERAQSRFVREAWIAGQLDHPNIIKVHSRGEENGVSYLAMEFAERGSLYDSIKETQRQVPSGSDITETIDQEYIKDILAKFIELAGALEHIHSKGFIHRDIKPHNILLAGEDKKFKFTDFGIAHAEDMTRMTRAGDFIGTVKYMSPELLTAHRAGIDKRTDIYSLGVTLYETLTLTLPFKADSEEKLVSEILSGHYIEARRTNRRIRYDLETVLMKACHQDREKRYQSASEFADDLQRIIDGRPILAKRQSALSKGYKYVRRNYKLVIGIAAAIVVIVGVFLLQDYRAKKSYDDSRLMQQVVSHKPDFTKIQIPTYPGNGVLSPDGEQLAFASGGIIWTLPLHGKVDPNLAGQPTRLTEQINAWNHGTINLMAWSGDGKWIAFNAWVENTSDAIYVVSSKGGKPHRVPVDIHRGSWVVNSRLSLSPDGTRLAFSSADKPLKEPDYGPPLSPLFIRTVSADGDDERRITGSPSREAAFSPDGSKLAFIAAGRTRQYADTTLRMYALKNLALYVVDTSGGQPTLVADLPGWESYPIWSPDGRMIAFSYWSEEDHHDIRIVPILDDGSPGGDPIVVEPPTHEFKLAGWSTNNQIGICASEPHHFALYTVPTSGGRAVQIAPEGVVQHPRWTPDGQQIYYQTATREVAVVPSEGGPPEVVPHLSADDRPRFYPHHYGSGNAVSPDGSTLLLSGTKEGTEGIHIWTLANGDNGLKQITNSPPSFEDCYPCWSPAGDSIAFLRYSEGNDRTDWQCNIYVVSADGGKPRRITADSDSVAWSVIAWSPAGEKIAFRSSASSNQNPDSMTIKTISVNGGIPETVAAVRDAYVTTSLTWAPDGTKIAYDYHTKSILVTSLEDSSITEVKTGLGDVELFYISWSPDGERFSFAALREGEEYFYLIEDFLQPVQVPEPEPVTPSESNEFSMKMIWTPDETYTTSQVSPDEDFIAFIDDLSGNLAIHRIADGVNKYLTDFEGHVPYAEQYADVPVISPDGRQIAYSWYNETDSATHLRLVDLNGSGDRLLFESNRTYNIRPESFSPDGERIAATVSDSTWSRELVLVSITDGSARNLKTLGKQELGHNCFSPNGEYIVYDMLVEGQPDNKDLFLMTVADGDTSQLVQHPANDALLGWIPNSDQVLFLSDRTGSWDAWAVKVMDGQPHGKPRLIRHNIGRIDPLGFSSSGAFYYNSWSGCYNVSIGQIDSATGMVVTPLDKPFAGSTSRFAWSPDGESMAYCRTRIDPAIPGGHEQSLFVRVLESGEERELHCKINRILGSPCWSPDGRRLLVRGFHTTDWFERGLMTFSLCVIDLEDGEDSLLFKGIKPGKGFGGGGGMEWSADGKSIFFVHQDAIVEMDVESGEKGILYSNPGLFAWLAMSPNGEELLIGLRSDARESVSILPIAGGEPRTLHSSPVRTANSGLEFEWMPSGQQVLLKMDENGRYSFWRVPVDGGPAEKILQLDGSTIGLQVHPDGKQIGVTTLQSLQEVWRMKNFLPKELARR